MFRCLMSINLEDTIILGTPTCRSHSPDSRGDFPDTRPIVSIQHEHLAQEPKQPKHTAYLNYISVNMASKSSESSTSCQNTERVQEKTTVALGDHPGLPVPISRPVKALGPCPDHRQIWCDSPGPKDLPNLPAIHSWLMTWQCDTSYSDYSENTEISSNTKIKGASLVIIWKYKQHR